jgi:hypothetical protein
VDGLRVAPLGREPGGIAEGAGAGRLSLRPFRRRRLRGPTALRQVADPPQEGEDDRGGEQDPEDDVREGRDSRKRQRRYARLDVRIDVRLDVRQRNPVRGRLGRLKGVRLRWAEGSPVGSSRW